MFFAVAVNLPVQQSRHVTDVLFELVSPLFTFAFASQLYFPRWVDTIKAATEKTVLKTISRIRHGSRRCDHNRGSTFKEGRVLFSGRPSVWPAFAKPTVCLILFHFP